MRGEVLEKLLCLPFEDVHALAIGQLTCILPRVQVQTGESFCLYPIVEESLTASDKYRSTFLTGSGLNTSTDHTQAQKLNIWATCEFSTIIYDESKIKNLSALTIWTEDFLKSQLHERGHLFLSCLRVYKLESIEHFFLAKVNLKEKLGKFIGISILQSEQESFKPKLIINKTLSVISDFDFLKRKQQIEEFRVPEFIDLEDLQSRVFQLIPAEPKAKYLNKELRIFFGWEKTINFIRDSSSLAWIQSINDLATRSQEQDDEKKSSYQAGTDFEDIVRKSLEFVGFKIEEAYKGGAGGLDLYCSQPYPLVGECKAGKRIPDRSVEELDRIGKRHLKEAYLQATRLIIGPGIPTPNLQTSAIISKTSIINAMSLQKLVQLQARYPGSVNLIELKRYLKPGQTDDKIDIYVEQVRQQILLRANVIQIVKKYQENTKVNEVNVGNVSGAYNYNSASYLSYDELKEMMIELASPLAGYLGRVKGTDRFYFLRELQVDEF